MQSYSDTNRLVLKAGAAAAAAGALLILVMVVIGASAGSAMAELDQPLAQGAQTAMLRPHAGTIIRVLAVDNLFLIAYTGAFIGAAALVWGGARLLAAAGLGFALLTALLDLIENAIIIHLARAALAEVGVQAAQETAITLGISAIGQVKYAGAGAGLVFFGLALLVVKPAGRRLRLAAVLLFLLFPGVNALALVDPELGLMRVAWMFLMLIVSAFLLWKSADRAPDDENR